LIFVCLVDGFHKIKIEAVGKRGKFVQVSEMLRFMILKRNVDTVFGKVFMYALFNYFGDAVGYCYC